MLRVTWWSVGNCVRLALLGASCFLVACGAAVLGAGIGALLGLVSLQVARFLFSHAGSIIIGRGLGGVLLAASAGVGAAASVLLLARLWWGRALQERDGREDAFLNYIDRLQL